ncbi:MAG: CBS domain-containing protein [Leptodesmis sp.]|uniref:CBS domain-containing protein n=1 Tax=Leptodesmis sp. TaxID=3100501 RepID=UPI003D149579
MHFLCFVTSFAAESLQLFQHLTPEDRDATALLLGFQPNMAGRLMTPEYLSLKEDQTVQQALDRIRRFANQVETISYLYVTDRDRRLTGTLSLRELVVTQLKTVLQQYR